MTTFICARIHRLRDLLFSILVLLSFLFIQRPANAQYEEVLFFDARADQTGSTNGGTAIWSLKSNTWRWWYQNVKQAAVSPNGKQVAYIVQDRLYLTNVKGQNPRQLSTSAAAFSIWSPKGDRIAYSSGFDLVIISPEGTELKRFAALAGIVSWSPDGRKIAYQTGVNVPTIGCELFAQDQIPCPQLRPLQTIFVLDIATGEKTQLFNPSFIARKTGNWKYATTTYDTIIAEQTML